MALLQHRINLDSAVFPLLSELLGRTIVIRGSDQTYPHTFATQIAADPPQLYYAHNVLPTMQGYQSVGYITFIPASVGHNFVDVVTLRDGLTGSSALLGITSSGVALISTLAVPTWTVADVSGTPSISGKLVTIAYVRGVTYIYFKGVGCYSYNFTTKVLDAVTLTGLTAANIHGIVGSHGYLLAFGLSNSIAWSSTVDPTDFTPSLITGAGAGVLDGAQGETVTAVAVQDGMIFFNATNATSGMYQGNERFPFAFTTIVGCGGLSDAKFAAYANLDSPAAYAYTTSGLQVIDTRQAKFLLPEVTDFLSGNKLEDFDETTLTLSTVSPGHTLRKRLAWIADRYLILSYGADNLTHALVFDTYTSRLGKLKLPHIATFEFTLYDQTAQETPKKSVGCISFDGTIKVVNTDLDFAASNGVAILGKYQYVRERLIQLQKVELENIPNSGAFFLYDMITLDGKTLQAPVAGYNTGNTGLSQKYNFHLTGINHSLLAKGNFNLVSGILGFNIAGKL